MIAYRELLKLCQVLYNVSITFWLLLLESWKVDACQIYCHVFHSPFAAASLLNIFVTIRLAVSSSISSRGWLGWWKMSQMKEWTSENKTLKTVNLDNSLLFNATLCLKPTLLLMKERNQQAANNNNIENHVLVPYLVFKSFVESSNIHIFLFIHEHILCKSLILSQNIAD